MVGGNDQCDEDENRMRQATAGHLYAKTGLLVLLMAGVTHGSRINCVAVGLVHGGLLVQSSTSFGESESS